MGDNQSLKSYLAAALMNGERYAPTITRFIADHFSELVPPPTTSPASSATSSTATTNISTSRG